MGLQLVVLLLVGWEVIMIKFVFASSRTTHCLKSSWEDTEASYRFIRLIEHFSRLTDCAVSMGLRITCTWVTASTGFD